MNMIKHGIGKEVDKPILLFLHYFGGSAQSWQWLMAELASDYDCMAVDLPGFGEAKAFDVPELKAYAEFVKNLMEQTKDRQYILIGHSMGGKIAVQTAIDGADTEMIRSVILVAPSPPSREPIPAEKRYKMRQHPDQSESLESVLSAVKIQLSDEQLQIACRTEQQIDIATRKWWVDEGTLRPVSENAKHLGIPVSLVISTQDPAITYETSLEESVKNLPDATSIFVHEKCGHLIPMEDPSWLASVIREILKNE